MDSIDALGRSQLLDCQVVQAAPDRELMANCGAAPNKLMQLLNHDGILQLGAGWRPAQAVSSSKR